MELSKDQGVLGLISSSISIIISKDFGLG